MRAVNLLPADARVSKSPLATFGGGLQARKTLQIGGAVTVVLAALLVAFFVHERSVVHSKRSALATDEARLVAVQAQVDAVKAAQASAAARVNAVQTVVDTRMNWDRTMGELARVLPTDAVLTSLQANAPIIAAAAATETPGASSVLSISGSAPSYTRVGVVLDRLALLPWLSAVTLTATSQSPGAPATFSITANVGEVH